MVQLIFCPGLCSCCHHDIGHERDQEGVLKVDQAQIDAKVHIEQSETLGDTCLGDQQTLFDAKVDCVGSFNLFDRLQRHAWDHVESLLLVGLFLNLPQTSRLGQELCKVLLAEFLLHPFNLGLFLLLNLMDHACLGKQLNDGTVLVVNEVLLNELEEGL